MRLKNGKYSNLHNTTAFDKAIKNVVVTLEQEITKDLFCVETGAAVLEKTDMAVDHTKIVKNVYTYTPANSTDKFFNLSHHSTTSGAVYITSIVINFVD